MKKRKKIKVAMIAPVFGDTGGPEVVVQNLTDALIEKGVDVTLFAPADWKTKAKHIPTLKKSLWKMKKFKDLTQIMIRNYIASAHAKILNYQKQFNIIHLHLQRHAYSVAANIKKPCILSFHSPFTAAELKMIKSTGISTVALSNTQRGDNKTTAVIWNGVPIKKIRPSYEKGKYLVAMGRIVDQKGIDRAIKISLGAGKKLLIFGRVGISEKRKRYFSKKIKPYIDGKRVVLMKEVPNKRIFSYLAKADALLFSIRKPEVCPMSVMEALACGTPIIGTKVGPLPELLRSRKIAFLSDNIKSLVKAAKNTDQFDRRECRKYAEKYFDSSVMAEKYIAVYEKILKNKK
jgi:glycosyltransferase involved in cell wall biosynthesis